MKRNISLNLFLMMFLFSIMILCSPVKAHAENIQWRIIGTKSVVHNDYPEIRLDSLFHTQMHSLLNTAVTDIDITIKEIIFLSNGVQTTKKGNNIEGLLRSYGASIEQDKVYALLEDDIIYIYSPSEKIYVTASLKTYSGAFQDFAQLTRVEFGNKLQFDTYHSDFSYMFKGCTKLENIDMSQYNFSAASAHSMFNGCTSLKTAKLKSFFVEDMGFMFYGCTSINDTVDIEINATSTTDMQYMFGGCTGLVRVSFDGMNISNVKDMAFMFKGCTNLQTVDMGNAQPTNVQNMSCMFYDCTNLKTVDFKTADISKVTQMSLMFANCSNLTELNLSNITNTGAADCSFMFDGCVSIKDLNLSRLRILDQTEFMIYGCSSLYSFWTPQATTILMIDYLPRDYFYFDNNSDGVPDSDEAYRSIWCINGLSNRFIYVIKPSQVIINGAKSNYYVGDVVQLSAQIIPEESYNKNVIWSSDNECVEVDQSGKIQCVESGTARIVAKAAGAANISATIIITVKEKASNTINKVQIKDVKGKNKQIIVTWKKLNNANKYEIQIASDPKFKKIIKKSKVNKNKKQYSVKLKKNGTYYVRIRGIDRKGKKGKWSKIKKIKVKNL